MERADREKLKRQGNFIMVPFGVALDSRIIGLGAVIAAYCISRPEGWVFHMNEIEARFKTAGIGKTAFDTAKKKLIESGYFIKHPKRVNGRLTCDWEFNMWAFENVTDIDKRLDYMLETYEHKDPEENKPLNKQYKYRKRSTVTDGITTGSGADAISSAWLTTL